jgi:PAS domain S-box-containing protein
VTDETNQDAGPDLSGSRARTDSIALVLWTCGPDGECLAVDPGALATGGDASSGRAPRSRWDPEVHPEDSERRRGAHRAAMSTGDPFEVEFRLRRDDGGWRWVLERGLPVFASGACSGLAAACLDVTERRRAEQELLRSREDLRLALAAGNMGTWVWDRRTGNVSRDHNLQRLYGLDSDPTGGSFDQWITLVHPDDRARLLEEVDRALAEGGTYELEHRVIRPDGEVRWLERRGEAYVDEAGEVVGTRGLVVDITERKRAEEERDRLLAAEQSARRAAELAAGRLARLQAVTSGLADARTSSEVADVIVVHSAGGLGAASGAVCLVAPDGERLEVVRHVGYEPSAIERYQTFSLDAPLPASEALRTREMILLGSLEERYERFPALRSMTSHNASFAAVPLFVQGRPAGVITLGWPEPRHFDDDDRAFLTALGQQAAQALDRAAFHEAEQQRAGRQGFLAEASRLLGSTLVYTDALAQVARLAVPTVADACSIHVLEDGELRPVAMELAGPGAEDVVRRLGPHSWCLGRAQLLQVATGDEPVLVSAVEDAHRRAWAEDAAHLALLGEVGARSAMAVPMRATDGALGVVVLAMNGSGRRYGPEDVGFVQDLADRAAAAVVNGRLHEARTTIALTLQHSLLPPVVPVLPGLEVAARYRPVGTDTEVGGDFFDVFAAGGGRWGVVIGDVSGKGIPAASLTALARYTVKTAARWETSPSGVLEVLNKSILDDGPGERFCTVAMGLLRHGTDGVRVSLSCAGQPLPLLLDDSGALRTVGEPGTAVGLIGNPRLVDVTFTLEPGQTLVLFTDGVVEARSPEGRFADGLLEAALAGCAGRSAEVVADTIERSLFEFVGGRPRDDTAVLVLRRPPGMFHQHVVPTGSTVPRTRRRLRAWLTERLPGAPDLVEDVVLLANELTTNAERVARTSVDLHVSVEDDRVVVDVSDDGPGFEVHLPPARPPATDALAGRGLHIVARLAHHSLVRSGSSGSLVRCVLDRAGGSLAPG